MIPVVVFSHDEITRQLVSGLSCCAKVSLIEEDAVHIEPNTDVLVIKMSDMKSCRLSDGILILSGNCDQVPCRSECQAIITDSSDTILPDIENPAQTQCITCGMKSTDTVSFSSLEDNKASVCLMREIRDLQGNAVEPFEAVIKSRSRIDRYSPFCLLCIVAVMALLGKTGAGLNLLID